MAFYEAVFIARSDISSGDVQKLTDKFTALIKELGGKVIKSEYWGNRQLAYVVRKNKKGHYVLLGLDAPTSAIKELERQFRLSEDVIRYLTVRVEAISKEPSPLLRSDEGEQEEAA